MARALFLRLTMTSLLHLSVCQAADRDEFVPPPDLAALQAPFRRPATIPFPAADPHTPEAALPGPQRDDRSGACRRDRLGVRLGRRGSEEPCPPDRQGHGGGRGRGRRRAGCDRRCGRGSASRGGHHRGHRSDRAGDRDGGRAAGVAIAEIAENTRDATARTREVAGVIGEVTRGAQATGRSADQVLHSADGVLRRSEQLGDQVRSFLAGVRAA